MPRARRFRPSLYFKPRVIRNDKHVHMELKELLWKEIMRSIIGKITFIFIIKRWLPKIDNKKNK